MKTLISDTLAVLEVLMASAEIPDSIKEEMILPLLNSWKYQSEHLKIARGVNQFFCVADQN